MPQRVRLFFGLTLGLILFSELRSSSPVAEQLLTVPHIVNAGQVSAEEFLANSFDHIVRTDPLRALEIARDDHYRSIRDYTCTFIKQELLTSGMTPEQVIAVNFRAEPYSVLMHWIKNPGKAERVLYVKGRWVDEAASNPDEREMAVCQPGAIARVFIKSLKQPIHGRQAKAASRRFIDEFGFGRSLDLLIKYCRIAVDRGELSLKYLGESEFAGRPTYVIERRLPYTGAGGDYPDRVALIHLDQEWRIPVSVRCYADGECTKLLGRYEYADVKLQANLSESVFDPKTHGM